MTTASSVNRKRTFPGASVLYVVVAIAVSVLATFPWFRRVTHKESTLYHLEMWSIRTLEMTGWGGDSTTHESKWGVHSDSSTLYILTILTLLAVASLVIAAILAVWKKVPGHLLAVVTCIGYPWIMIREFGLGRWYENFGSGDSLREDRDPSVYSETSTAEYGDTPTFWIAMLLFGVAAAIRVWQLIRAWRNRSADRDALGVDKRLIDAGRPRGPPRCRGPRRTRGR